MGVRLRKRGGYEVDMLHGPLLPKIIRFAVLLMVSNMLQLLYNAADLIVVGQFSGSDTAVAAVGATGSLCNLIVNFFIGLSVGRMNSRSNLLEAEGMLLSDFEKYKTLYEEVKDYETVSGSYDVKSSVTFGKMSVTSKGTATYDDGIIR